MTSAGRAFFPLESVFELRPGGAGQSEFAVLLSLHPGHRSSSRRCRLHLAFHSAFCVGGNRNLHAGSRLGPVAPAAFFAAFVFMFSGPVLSLGDLYNESACFAWIPWALLVTDRALGSRRLRLWLLLSVIFAVQWLAGEPFTFLATFGLCFAYAIYRRGLQAPDSGLGRMSSVHDFRPGRLRNATDLRGYSCCRLLTCSAIPAADCRVCVSGNPPIGR